MAHPVALKRLLASPTVLARSLRPLCAATQPVSSRLFNTNAIREYDSGDRDVDVDRRPNYGVFSPFSDVWSPFSPRSILNVMDQFMESPVASSIRRNWDVRETDEGLHLRMDMPGLGKEDVKVSVEHNTLVIKGQGKEELEDDEAGRRYSHRIDLPQKLYNANEVKAEMKNGVLRVFVPKIKEEERSDVFHVNVE